jgi:hypothetical protein
MAGPGAAENADQQARAEPPRRINFTPRQDALIRASRPTFAFPCYGGNVSFETLSGMINTSVLLTKIGIRFDVRMIASDALVSRARNSLVALMMEIPESTHLMFIDVDIGFDPVDIARLIGHDLDVVGGVYPMKQYPLRYAFNPLREGGKTDIPGVQQVKDLATGFMLIKRSVIERMIEHYPETRYDADVDVGQRDIKLYALFDTELRDGKFVSEDFTFCRRWRAIGGKVHIDETIVLKHLGLHSYMADPNSVHDINARYRREAENAKGGGS